MSEYGLGIDSTTKSFYIYDLSRVIYTILQNKFKIIPVPVFAGLSTDWECAVWNSVHTTLTNTAASV